MLISLHLECFRHELPIDHVQRSLHVKITNNDLSQRCVLLVSDNNKSLQDDVLDYTYPCLVTLTDLPEAINKQEVKKLK